MLRGPGTSTALYEWNYPRQMLRIRLTENSGATLEEHEAQIFGEHFLLKRPLLDAITQYRAPFLLIDEVDRADEAFEAFLLEVLGEFQVTIPELGTIRARARPSVILTSNRTRELSDALRRRCLYLWQPYPTIEQETAILMTRLPAMSESLAGQITRMMAFLRDLPLNKAPGITESLDWAIALMSLHRDTLDMLTVERTLGCILKAREDWELLATQRERLGDVLAQQAAPSPAEPDFGLGTVTVKR